MTTCIPYSADIRRDILTNKSPSGSLCPYYYMGGELHPLKYGSFFGNKSKLFEIIRAEEEFILKSPGEKNRRIWIDIYETEIDGMVTEILVSHLINIKPKINRICFVGFPQAQKVKFMRKVKSSDAELYETIRFFKDPEDAKMWLIGR